jgi:hypothetical protein
MKKHFKREGLWFKRERLWMAVYFFGPILVGLVAVIIAQAGPVLEPHVAHGCIVPLPH